MAEDEWISAIEASRLLEAAGQHKNHARHALIRNAAGGVLRTRCLKLTTWDLSHGGPPDEDDKTEVFNADLLPRFWAGVNHLDLRNGGDWESGDFAATLDDGMTHYSTLRVEFHLADVLEFPILSPASKIPDKEMKEVSPGAPAKLPKVEKKTLHTWTQKYLLTHPGASFEAVLDASKRHFAGRYNVTQRPLKAIIAELGGTLNVGNPTILQRKTQN